jgi:hypothetical protein
MQRAHLGSMERKCDTAWRRGDVRRRRGSTGEETGRRQYQLGRRESYCAKKIKKIHAVDSIVINDGEYLKQ